MPADVAPKPVAQPPATPLETCLDAAAAFGDPRDAAVARALCGDLRNLGVPGAAIAIAEGGAIVLQFAGGVRCLGKPERVATSTAFRIGSLTKAVTAAIVFGLAHDRLLSLDAPIGASALARVGLDDTLASATIRQLLDHRAGLVDILPNEAMRTMTDEQQLAALVGTPVAGTAWRYANGGYALAGALAERASGTAWPDLVTRAIATPLGMTQTRARPDPSGDVACGHLQQGEALTAFDVRTDYETFAFGVEAAAPSGAVIASATDVVRFGLALAGHGDPPPAFAAMRRAILEESQPTGRGGDERYAAGMSLVRGPDGERIVRHAGNTGDFAAELVWLVDRDVVIAVVGNRGVTLAATQAAAMQRVGADPRR